MCGVQSFKPLRSGALDRTGWRAAEEAGLRPGFKPLRSGALDRTILGAVSDDDLEVRFKPLRSGALDRTSGRETWWSASGIVSNPFVAGHWIVPRRGGGSSSTGSRVSNPFVAGHWIVRATRATRSTRSTEFQTPS